MMKHLGYTNWKLAHTVYIIIYISYFRFQPLTSECFHTISYCNPHINYQQGVP